MVAQPIVCWVGEEIAEKRIAGVLLKCLDLLGFVADEIAKWLTISNHDSGVALLLQPLVGDRHIRQQLASGTHSLADADGDRVRGDGVDGLKLRRIRPDLAELFPKATRFLGTGLGFGQTFRLCVGAGFQNGFGWFYRANRQHVHVEGSRATPIPDELPLANLGEVQSFAFLQFGWILKRSPFKRREFGDALLGIGHRKVVVAAVPFVVGEHQPEPLQRRLPGELHPNFEALPGVAGKV